MLRICFGFFQIKKTKRDCLCFFEMTCQKTLAAVLKIISQLCRFVGTIIAPFEEFRFYVVVVEFLNNCFRFSSTVATALLSSQAIVFYGQILGPTSGTLGQSAVEMRAFCGGPTGALSPRAQTPFTVLPVTNMLVLFFRDSTPSVVVIKNF